MRTNEIYLLLTFLVLLIDFGLIWFLSFRFLRKDLRSALHYSALTLFSLIGLIAYYALSSFLVDRVVKGHISNMVIATTYGTVMFCYLLIIPTFILTLVLTIIHFAKRQKKVHNML